MSWTPALRRICIVASFTWIVVVASALGMGCFDSPLSPVCDVGAEWLGLPVDKALSEFSFTDWIGWIELAAWPPLAVISLGYIASLLIRVTNRKGPG